MDRLADGRAGFETGVGRWVWETSVGRGVWKTGRVIGIVLGVCDIGERVLRFVRKVLKRDWKID